MTVPPAHWLLGHLPYLAKDPLSLLDACEGTYVRLKIGRTAWLLLEPPDIAHVLESDAYSKGRAFAFGRRLYGNSLLVSEAESHYRQAKVIGRLFICHAARSFLEPTATITQRLTEKWQTGQEIDLWSVMNDLALAISSRAIFGDDWLPSWLPGGSKEGDQLRVAFDAAMSHIARQNFSLLALPDWLPISPVRRYRAAVDFLNRAVATSIEKRRLGQAEGGFLDHLLAAKDAEGQPLSFSEVRDQSLMLTLGGYESTATTLCWTLLLINRYPEIRRRLVAEVHDVVGNRLPTPEDVPRLPFVGQVFSESLRLYPPPWLIPRTSLRRDVLPSGLRLPSGAQVFVSPYRTQRDERYFPNPLDFDPERFSGSASRSNAAYFPFGGGPRHCLGESIARVQVTIILAVLCRSWSLNLEGTDFPQPHPLLTMRPPVPLRLKLSRVAPSS